MTDPKIPTSVRFTADELDLIDKAAAALSVSRGFGHSRTDVIKTALKRLQPPEGLGPELADWRRAYGLVFREAPKETR